MKILFYYKEKWKSKRWNRRAEKYREFIAQDITEIVVMIQ